MFFRKFKKGYFTIFKLLKKERIFICNFKHLKTWRNLELDLSSSI